MQKIAGPSDMRFMLAWPSGLRRQLKALVRKGVGSNPTADTAFWLGRELYILV